MSYGIEWRPSARKQVRRLDVSARQADANAPGESAPPHLAAGDTDPSAGPSRSTPHAHTVASRRPARIGPETDLRSVSRTIPEDVSTPKLLQLAIGL